MNEQASNAVMDNISVDLTFTDSIRAIDETNKVHSVDHPGPLALFIVNAEQCQSFYEDINALSTQLVGQGFPSQLVLWSENPNISERMGLLAKRHVNVPVYVTVEQPTVPLSSHPDLSAILVLKNSSTYSNMARISTFRASENVGSKVLELLVESIIPIGG